MKGTLKGCGMEQFCNRKHAEEILAPCGIADYIRFDERGVWPNIPRDNLAMDEADADDLRWTPGRVFKDDGHRPEAAETPSLPFPFTARELAAFMVDGLGALVFGFYAGGGAAPSPVSLIALDPDSMSRTAVRNAFAAYNKAKDAAPELTSGALNTRAMVRYLLKTDAAKAHDTGTGAAVMAEGFTQSKSAPAPQVDSTVVKHVTKSRDKGAIPHIIDEIKKADDKHSSSSTWEALKTLALDCRAPFTGAISGKDEPEVAPGSLAFTNTKNTISWYTRRNLTDYLGRK